MEWDDMLLERFPYPTETVVYFTDQNWISKIEYWLRFLMVCKIFSCSEFPKRMEKIGKCKEFTFLRASMVVTNYIKLLRTGADKRNGILMPLLRLVTETKKIKQKQTKNYSRFMPSTNMKQLFKGVLHTNCSQNFGKFSRKYPWSGLFHRERAPKRIFS